MPADPDPWHPANLLPLSVLTAEGFGGGNVDTLAHRLGDAVILDDVGIRCTTRATARQLFAERAAALAEAQARDAARRAHLAEQAQKNPPRGGKPARPGSSALADLMEGEGRW